ncbi:MAG: hypothetical protein E7300_12545 [Lachnospiraceae bacterium]|nr:hypothetical protein [Lachnospiraceae bacterium]
MGYTMLDETRIKKIEYPLNGLEGAALSFIRENCQGLRFDKNKATTSKDAGPDEQDGTSLKENQIPYNMEKDIDRLCLENALDRFLKSGRKEDAFDVYFCYLEMFIGDYEKTRRMIELLSEFEANGSGLLMKHRDHYVHSVYVFSLGLAIYQANKTYRETYKAHYALSKETDAAAHYLKFWGLASLFHDIGYPFELPFEQVCSYFEVSKEKRDERPYMAYRALDSLIEIQEESIQAQLRALFDGKEFQSTNEIYSYYLSKKLGDSYGFTEDKMLSDLTKKPTNPEEFKYFMDHAYFSATVLFKKLFTEMQLPIEPEHIDALTAILMHNSLYKFCITDYKKEGNKPLKASLHPLAYMLMLCDELQCWDRTAYGRNSKKELHPMGCTFEFKDDHIQATYLYDENERGKIDLFKDRYISWIQDGREKGEKCPELKAYSGMFIKEGGKSEFQADIERIVDLSEITLGVATGITQNVHVGSRGSLSDSNFINLYNFAVVLNARWESTEWKTMKLSGKEEQFLNDDAIKDRYVEGFKKLSLEYKLSNINQAKAFAKYLSVIGCFYTSRDVDYERVKNFTHEELLKIGILEHQRWLQEHYDMGWTYGTPDKDERERVRLHKDMIPEFREFNVSYEAALANYRRLDKEEQDKDTEPMECMLAMLRMFDGLRIYRL